MKLLKIILMVLLIYTNFNFSSALMFSEINFRGDEFVEIVLSNSSIVDSFNESYFIVDNFKSTNNTFSLYNSVENSTILLIVGQNWISNNQDIITEIDCTIFQTNRNQVGFGGLSVNGEAFTVHFNSNTSLEFLNEQTPSATEGESVHFNATSTFISNHSPCALNELQQDIFNATVSIPENEMESNISNSNEGSSNISNEDIIIPNCELTLDVDEIIEDTRIQFKFMGNISYGVTYYVEDGVGNTVRNPFTSSTPTPKSYTPRKNGKFIVFGYIDDESCGGRVDVNATTFFYNPELDIDADTSSSSSRVPRVQEDTFLQINQVLQEGFNQVRLIGEVSRGNSNAYRFSVNVNRDRVSEFDIKRYGHFDFQIPLQLEAGENVIEIQGFGLRDSVEIEMPDITNDLEDTIILLMHKHGLTSSNNENNKIESSSLSSVELQESARQSASDSSSHLEVNASQIDVNETSSSDSNELLFSKHFFHQNIGIITIVGGLVLVAGVIIAMR
ncbi:MAG: hypothetical protein ACMXYB_00040 [Candidatus Woesearchaeota archaeon]